MNQNLTLVSESFLETINEKQDKIISLLQDGKLGSQNDFITENEAEFIQAAISLSNSKEKRASLGSNAKQYIENNYQIEPITKKIIEFIQHIS